MKRKLINFTLGILLIIPLYGIYYYWNDAQMQMKHWFILMMFEAILQIIIERSFRKKL